MIFDTVSGNYTLKGTDNNKILFLDNANLTIPSLGPGFKIILSVVAGTTTINSVLPINNQTTFTLEPDDCIELQLLNSGFIRSNFTVKPGSVGSARINDYSVPINKLQGLPNKLVGAEVGAITDIDLDTMFTTNPLNFNGGLLVDYKYVERTDYFPFTTTSRFLNNWTSILSASIKKKKSTNKILVWANINVGLEFSLGQGFTLTRNGSFISGNNTNGSVNPSFYPGTETGTGQNTLISNQLIHMDTFITDQTLVYDIRRHYSLNSGSLNYAVHGGAYTSTFSSMILLEIDS